MATIMGASFLLLFLAIISPSYGQNVTEVWVSTGQPLELRCPLRVEQRLSWRKDGRGVSGEAAESAAGGGGGLTARLSLGPARAALAGLYTCADPPGHAVRVHVSTTDVPNAEPPTTMASAMDDWPAFWFDLHRPFSLVCNNTDVDWFKEGKPVASVKQLDKRYEVRTVGEQSFLDIKGRSSEDDAGAYTCVPRTQGETEGFGAKAKALLRLPSDAGTVEGQKLRIACRVQGRPAPRITWLFSNDTVNGTDVREALGAERVTLSGAFGEELVVEVSRRGDAGTYMCTAPSQPGVAMAQVVVRVKDMYAALWPFLGICAEVLLLCAIILVYERRRAKPAQQADDDDDNDQKKS